MQVKKVLGLALNGALFSSGRSDRARPGAVAEHSRRRRGGPAGCQACYLGGAVVASPLPPSLAPSQALAPKVITKYARMRSTGPLNAGLFSQSASRMKTGTIAAR